MFVKGLVTLAPAAAAVLVPRNAVQSVAGRDVVFVEQGDALVAVPVRLGAGDADRVEVLSGLEPGQRYVAENAFVIKAELGKDRFGGHGHPH